MLLIILCDTFNILWLFEALFIEIDGNINWPEYSMEMRQGKFELSISIKCYSQSFSSSAVITINICSISSVFYCLFIVPQKIMTPKNIWYVKKRKQNNENLLNLLLTTNALPSVLFIWTALDR